MTKLSVDLKKENIDVTIFDEQSTRAKEIKAQFQPMLDKMEEMEGKYNEVIAMPEGEEKFKKAKEVRLELVKVRTGTDKIRKEQKAFYLQASRYIDAWGNVQKFAGSGMEEKLKEIEETIERQKQAEIDSLAEKRADLLKPYIAEGAELPKDLGTMEDMVFDSLLIGAQTTFNNRREAEQKAAEQDLKNQQIQKDHEERDKILRNYWDYLTNDEKQLNFGEWSKEEFATILARVKISKENDKASQEAKEQELLAKTRVEQRTNAMLKLGFTLKGSDYYHPETGYTVNVLQDFYTCSGQDFGNRFHEHKNHLNFLIEKKKKDNERLKAELKDDKTFLQMIHDRLIQVYKEDQMSSDMIRLRGIIEKM